MTNLINNICIKQEPGSDYCVARVAAMATGTTLDQFRKIMGDKGPYSDWHFSAYCMLHGFVVGVGAGWNPDNPLDPARYAMNISLDLELFPAYVVVQSETRPGAEHAVYWNTKWVLDPNPTVDRPRELDSYRVVSVFPIQRLNDDGNLAYGIMRKVIAKRLHKK